MIKIFKTHNGQSYSLSGCVVNGRDRETINRLDRQYLLDAQQMAKDKKCHVFYNLKKFGNNGYDSSQYFLVPIDEYDAEEIPLKFNSKNTDYWIGIAYYHDMPELPYSEKMAIRETYWNTISGYEYEEECAEYLRQNGFTDVDVTSKSGDQGVDIIAWKDGLKYGIQCKHYQGAVSNKAVQEVCTGAKHYKCDIAVVMTNSTFTESAKELAHSVGVKLWSSDERYKL